MKFGGTSIQNPSVCKRVINIIKNTSDPRKVIVFSAMGKITRKLLALSQSYADQKETAVKRIFQDIRSFHHTLSQSLISDSGSKKIIPLMDSYFKQIIDLGEEIQKRKKLEPRMQDRMLSYGELLSTAIMTNAMKSNGLKASLLDSRDFIITDSSFTGAKPLIKETYEKINIAIPSIVEKKEIPVIQGFIGSNFQGVVTTLGFEGSDLTASLIGAALRVDEIQIWKNVSGIMTADPCICSKAKSIENITFKEAFELSKAGAKVLHPRTTTPAAEKDIPIRIKNSTRPEEIGTLISNQNITSDVSIKSIVCKIVHDKALLTLVGQGIAREKGIIQRIIIQIKDFSFTLQEDDNPDTLIFIFDKADMEKAVELTHNAVF
ncbi:MAG: aspartate kinase [bacterium]